MLEIELAQSIKENDMANMFGGPGNFEVAGVPVYLLHHGMNAGMAPYQLNRVAVDNMRAEKELYSESSLAPKTIEFIKEVDSLREQNGCAFPMDITSGLFFITAEEPEAKQLELGEFDFTPYGTPDLRDVSKYRTMLDKIIENDHLRERLKSILSVGGPDGMNSMIINTDSVINKLESLGITSGILIELGCGTGESASDIKAKSDMNVIGIERQYHPQWYNPYWQEMTPGLSIVRSDFTQGIPLKDDVADATVLKYVVNYITPDALKAGLDEAKRVLKPNGVLIVGPQKGSVGNSPLSAFRKTVGENSSSFEEIK